MIHHWEEYSRKLYKLTQTVAKYLKMITQIKIIIDRRTIKKIDQ